MNAKKYQVFISSTYIDLIEERRKILDILLMADCIPAGMESFVATDNEQFEVIKKVIDLCDYYVLIIGKRYGSVNKNTGLSYTEMEYDYAKSKGIPVLVFSLDESMELAENKIEKDQENVVKLDMFRKKAMNNRLVSIWKTVDDLTGQLAIAIMRAKSEISRPGWQRASDFDEASLRREIMEQQKLNSDLEKELSQAKKTIDSLTKPSDLAFENYEVDILYYYYQSKDVKRDGSTSLLLSEIFQVIALEMLEVAISESSIEKAIRHKVSKNNYIHFKDNQLIKRILNQLKALDLISSNWSKERSALYWSLTTKGKKTRDEMILIKCDQL